MKNNNHLNDFLFNNLLNITNLEMVSYQKGFKDGYQKREKELLEEAERKRVIGGGRRNNKICEI